MSGGCILGDTFHPFDDPMAGLDLSLQEQKTRKLDGAHYFRRTRFEFYRLLVPHEKDRQSMMKIDSWDPFSKDMKVLYDRNLHTGVLGELDSLFLCGPSRPPEVIDSISFMVYKEGMEGMEAAGFSVDIDFYKKDVILSIVESLEYILVDSLEYTVEGIPAPKLRESPLEGLINLVFEEISFSVEAFIDITLPAGRLIGGKICATTEGHELTKRTLLSSEKFDNPLRLDRRVLAVRVREFLHFHFDLKVIDDKGVILPYKGEARIQAPEVASEISGVCNIVPETFWSMLEKRGEKHTQLSDCESKLLLQITIRYESSSVLLKVKSK